MTYHIKYIDFDWKAYIKMYPKLKLKNKKEAYYHWSLNLKNYGEYYIDEGNAADKYYENKSCLLYILYHDDESYLQIEKYKDVSNIKLLRIDETKYFESIFFNYLSNNRNEWTHKKYVGMVTYSFESKNKQNILSILEKIEKYSITEKVIFALGHFVFPQLSDHINYQHNTSAIMEYLLKIFNINCNYEKCIFFACNYWMASPVYILEYIYFYQACMYFCENDKNIIKLLNEKAHYKGKCSSKKLLQICGFPHYTHHCFVFERLPCVFFNSKLFTVIQIISN
jgi:hypothetical protein